MYCFIEQKLKSQNVTEQSSLLLW